MLLALVRHGKAAEAKEDALRPLSVQGIEQVHQLAVALKHQDYKFDLIFHSGLVRAEQTAIILQERAFPKASLMQKDTLHPESRPSEMLNDLLEHPQSLMLVGHMPFMGKLANILGADSCDFSTAGCLVFQRDKENLSMPFRLIWERN